MSIAARVRSQPNPLAHYAKRRQEEEEERQKIVEKN